MKLLIVEYINSGGFVGQALPSSLAAEGALMLQTLLDDLKSLPDITLLLPLDHRCQSLSLPENCRIHWLADGESLLESLPELLACCDAIWPIAPESDGILTAIAEIAERSGKILLLSASEIVALCGDKLETYKVLYDADIPVVETIALLDDSVPIDYPCVLKPKHGAGCDGSFIAETASRFQQCLSGIANAENYIRQPLIDGDAISLSCLFAEGRGWLLACNRQLIARDDGRFRLQGCMVNLDTPHRQRYRQLIDSIASALPGLWGYIGIDLIETTGRGPLLLELNPRLTTSYAGIRRASGVNVAELVIQLLSGTIELPPAKANSVTVLIE